MEINWDKVGEQAAELLAALIRINTSNPPGNEAAACGFLKPIYARLGLEPVLLGPEPSRQSIIGRLKAEKPEGEPLLLLSHLDTVPADAKEWSKPPFAGAIEGGEVWGRGALDCKNATAVELTALKLFVEAGHQPRRDLILAATADEEMGGERGVGWLVEHHFDLLRAGFGINEGGGFSVKVAGREVFLCQTGEKGICWIKLTAQGPSGHASTPPAETAMTRIVKALAAVMQHKQPLRLTDTVRVLVDQVASQFGPVARVAARAALSPLLEEYALRRIKSAENRNLARAVIHNTVTLTGLKGGDKVNVIPGEVIATLDCRVIPGFTPEQMLAEVRQIVEPFGVTVETIATSTGGEMPADSELYRALGETLRAHSPQAILAPYLMPGGTDGRYLVQKGVKVYGFIPLQMEAGDQEPIFRRFHGKDERVSIQNLIFGARLLYDLLVRFCAR
jgi:acetylornithine deacetylase/succinyl-diaminopimelate desuccinylase-like protein